MVSKQDRTYTRTPEDLERKYSFGKSFNEVKNEIRIATNTAEQAEKVAKKAQSEILQLTDSIALTVENGVSTAQIKLKVGDKEIPATIDMKGLVTFSNLSNADGTTVINGSNITTGQILADLIKAGVLKSKDGESVVIDLDNGTVNLVGVIKSQQEAGKRTMMTPETITAQSLYDKVYASLFPGSLQLQDAYEYLYSVINTGEWRMYDADNTYEITAKIDKTNQIALLELQGKAGSTLSIFSSNGGANHIRGLSNPIGSTDAATKGYVDTNFAPAGYGLGTATSESEDLNNETMCGWKAFTKGCANAPFDYGLVMTMNRYGNQITQIAFNPYMAGKGQICVRHYYSGTWYDWEYVNPPMLTGVEYRTTERWNGKVVYTKLLNFGLVGDSGSMSLMTGADAKNIIRFSPHITDGTYAINSLPYINEYGNIEITSEFEGGVMWLHPQNDNYANYTAEVQIWYTKD